MLQYSTVLKNVTHRIGYIREEERGMMIGLVFVTVTTNIYGTVPYCAVPRWGGRKMVLVLE